MLQTNYWQSDEDTSLGFQFLWLKPDHIDFPLLDYKFQNEYMHPGRSTNDNLRKKRPGIQQETNLHMQSELFNRFIILWQSLHNFLQLSCR